MVVHKSNPTTTHFLNVDLDIYSRADLRALISALGKKVVVLYQGRVKQTYCAHLELTRITKTADATIRAFCSLIEALPKPERNLWNAAKVRDFSIGVQASTQPNSTDFALSAEALKACHEFGARIVFTVYAAETLRKPVAKGRAHPRKAVGARLEPAV